MYKEKII